MPETLSNKEVGKVLKLLASLMELHGENDFRTRSYSNAAFQVGRVPEPVISMDKTTLENTKGIGKSVAGKIVELAQSGRIQALDDLLAQTPEGVAEMLQIKGLGAKKVAVIWQELGVETPGELLYACYENRLAKLKGFGDKTQQSVIDAIEYFQSNQGKFHFAVADIEARAIESGWPDNGSWERTGILRREDLIVEQLEWITTGTDDTLPVPEGWTPSADGWAAVSPHGIPMRLIQVTPEEKGIVQFRTTGTPDHVAEVEKRSKAPLSGDEVSIYEGAGLPFIPPWLREDLAEWDLAAGNKLDEIIRLEDLRGVVHNHSTWSDGRNTLREMAEACMKLGYEYLVISDHSKTAVYAGGLEVERVIQQHKEIEQLNVELAPFRIFKSIESDILNDGSLDYPDDILQQFDLVIASVHQNLRMDPEKATSRLMAAVENRYTAILGHMTGRLLLSRPGYQPDHKKIIDACVANGVAIEVNANPYRLDMDYHWIPYAMEKGLLMCINPDAHSVEGIADMHWGVCAARKGGLLRAQTLNALPLEAFEKWVSDRRAAKGID
ncbi:MAG TPA: helix-hairpin-helix domain-containing protein [Chitinophagales bacterium]|nr:helix-hairpin-helix domain-containing protein [Chitinophagales bacterium]